MEKFKRLKKKEKNEEKDSIIMEMGMKYEIGRDWEIDVIEEKKWIKIEEIRGKKKEERMRNKVEEKMRKREMEDELRWEREWMKDNWNVWYRNVRNEKRRIRWRIFC